MSKEMVVGKIEFGSDNIKAEPVDVSSGGIGQIAEGMKNLKAENKLLEESVDMLQAEIAGYEERVEELELQHHVDGRRINDKLGRIEQLEAALKESTGWNWLGEEYHKIPQAVHDQINEALDKG